MTDHINGHMTDHTTDWYVPHEREWTLTCSLGCTSFFSFLREKFAIKG